MAPTRVPLLYGAAAFGMPGSMSIKNTVRVTDANVAQQIVDKFTLEFGGKELDTARAYAEGTSEQALSLLDIHGASIDTKCFPRKPGDHSPENLRSTIKQSVAALGNHKIRTFYLHVPDRSVPYEITLAEIDKLHKEGLFEAFGLSNFYAWEVAEIYNICKERNYVLPTIYQGPYSLFARTNEVELFPALRKYNIRFVAYSVLVGGMLKGDPKRPGGRYDPNTHLGPFQLSLYTQGKQSDAVELIRNIAEKHDLTVGEVALRWIQHHSLLTPNDGVIIGAGSVAQLEENCTQSQKGPLPDEVVQVIEQAWNLVKADALPYAAGFDSITAAAVIKK